MALSRIAETTVAPQVTSSGAGNAPSGTQVGDLLLAMAAWDNASGSLSSTPSDWTQLDRLNDAGRLGLWIGYKVSAGEASFTWGYSAPITNGIIIRTLRGQAAAPIPAHGPIAQTASNTVSSTAITVPAAGWFVCFFGCYSTGATVSTPPAGLGNAAVAANQASYDSTAPDPGSIAATLVWSQNGGQAYAEGIAVAAAPPPATPSAASQRSISHSPRYRLECYLADCFDVRS